MDVLGLSSRIQSNGYDVLQVVKQQRMIEESVLVSTSIQQIYRLPPPGLSLLCLG